ncbi:hypothetical protein [Vallitalea okinawensis]|uniref:hypothetical protein n=1 Tax=Vallitalea okinawensis TaxID=2078660 RepID=UPI000CFB96D8|nr:hypothetical protein [Vallitalea okinawensis]
MSSPVFKFEKILKGDKKYLYCYGKGFFEKEDGMAYRQKLLETIQSIDTKEYILVIDSSKTKPTTGDAIPILQECHKLYHETEFKEKYFVETKSATTYLQKLRTDDVGLYENIKLVSSASEILD